MSLSSAHWYDATGQSCHLTVGKNGKERATTIKDAREKGLFPSVTTILGGVLAKEQLVDWKLNQVAWAAVGNAPKEGEDEKAWLARVKAEAFKQVQDAADLGTAIHAALENFFKDQPYDHSLSVYVNAVDRWLQANQVEIIESELRLVNKVEGYAGTTDAKIVCPRGKGILDFKTRKTSEKYKVEPWDDQPTQVAAYIAAAWDNHIPVDACGCNLFVSTTEPGRVVGCWYDAAQMREEWEVFKHTNAIFRQRKGHDPRQQ